MPDCQEPNHTFVPPCDCRDTQMVDWLSKQWDGHPIDCYYAMMAGIYLALRHPEWARWQADYEHFSYGCKHEGGYYDCNDSGYAELVEAFPAEGDPNG